MAEKLSTYIDVVKVSSLIFGALIIIVFCLAQYVGSVVVHSGEMPEAIVAENLTLPGRVYPRQ